MRRVQLASYLLGGLLIQFAAATADPQQAVPLIEVLRRAEAYSPRLRGAKYQEEAATQNINVRRSRYMPDLSAAVVASTGMPGSFAMFDVDGDISSSQRVGLGGALVLKQDIWDFGRTSSAVEVAEGQRELQQKQFKVLKMEIDLDVLNTYLSCAFLRAQIDNARFSAAQAKLMASETDRFVRSGQRSIVERYLVDAEAKEAETRIAEYSERLNLTQERLALELGMPKQKRIVCTDLATAGMSLKELSRNETNPIEDVQQARLQIAQSNLQEAKSESRPVLFGMAVAGYFDNTHLTDKTNYAAGVGIKMPLFEGFRIQSEIELKQAEVKVEQAGLESSKLLISRVNSKYDEQLSAMKVRLEFLEREKILAKEVFALAKKRYLSLHGTMIDLRESIRNMNRILQSTDEAYRDLFIARGEQMLVNSRRE